MRFFCFYTTAPSVDRKKHCLTYCDGPPVTKLTDGVGHDESGKPENSQELREKMEEDAKKKKISAVHWQS